MIELSTITNGISNAAHIALGHAKNLCVDSKITTVFRTTIGVAQAHPYIAILGTGVAVYCSRGQIGSLVNKVKQATQFLYTKATGSMISLMNLLRRSLVSLGNPKNDSSLENTKGSSGSTLEKPKDNSSLENGTLSRELSESSIHSESLDKIDNDINTQKTGTNDND